MSYSKIRYSFLAILFTFITLTACVDDFAESNDDFQVDNSDIPEGIRSGYSLNFTVTLDNMGGSKLRNAEEPSLSYYLDSLEHYINPEKFRVLFFDAQDTFLFESKSRWVKKLDPKKNNSEWLVSVPVFTYGNDVYEDNEKKEYDWESIRDSLTTKKFKVAILVNRPDLDYYPGFKDLMDGLPDYLNSEKNGGKSFMYDNRGPFWGPDSTGKKDIFDLHHCQFDPMYFGKGTQYGYYNFIMGNWEATQTAKPTMGATCSWVDWIKSGDWGGSRCFILPSYEHPIPMYGVQEFDPIEGWVKGTPVNLSKMTDNGSEREYNYKSISLLRSSVRLELLIPKTDKNGNTIPKPNFVMLVYPNVYSRCDPMDVWTPTDELWYGKHGDQTHQHTNDCHLEVCELDNIMKYGPISLATEENKDYQNSDTKEFHKKISWFYGAWKDKGWPFTGYTGYAVEGDDFRTRPEESETYPYPRIFNTCTQRNTQVSCEDVDLSDLDPVYYHYVVYTGERNLNDPSKLYAKNLTNSGEPTIIYWKFNIGQNVYSLPITNYNNSNNPARNISSIRKEVDFTDPKVLSAVGGKLDNNNFLTNSDFPDIEVYMNAVQGWNRDQRIRVPTAENRPWPLIRNHVYRLTIEQPQRYQSVNRASSTGGGLGLSIKADKFHSETLKFK